MKIGIGLQNQKSDFMGSNCANGLAELGAEEQDKSKRQRTRDFPHALCCDEGA